MPHEAHRRRGNAYRDGPGHRGRRFQPVGDVARAALDGVDHQRERRASHRIGRHISASLPRGVRLREYATSRAAGDSGSAASCCRNRSAAAVKLSFARPAVCAGGPAGGGHKHPQQPAVILSTARLSPSLPRGRAAGFTFPRSVMTHRRLSWPVITVLTVATIEIVAGLVMTLRPGACRSSDAVAVLTMSPGACVEARRIGARCGMHQAIP